MAVWSENIIGKVAHVVTEYHPDGLSVDDARTGFDGPILEFAEAIGNAAAAHGILLPFEDAHLAAVLARDGRAADPARRGAVVALADGRLGLSLGRGRTVESVGGELAIITTPEPGRYIAAWLLPGVAYLGGNP